MMNSTDNNDLKYWNEKILIEINLIKDNQPELLKFIEELNVTIPDVNKPEITVHQLKSYYNTLLTIIKKYESLS